MANSVSFLPWVYVDEAFSVGPIRFIPYERKRSPGDLPHVTQEVLDILMSAYVSQPGKPIRRATIIEYGDWYAGQECPAEIRQDMWRVKNAIACSALANRLIFGKGPYASTASYALITQGYQSDNPSGYAIQTRRRDGYGLQYWTSDTYTLNMPLQVQHCDRQVKIDEPLLLALLNNKSKKLTEAVKSYCESNTDSEEIQLHVEMLKLMKAFEGLLNCKTKSTDFLDAIRKAFSDVDLQDYDGPLKEKWMEPRGARVPANVLEAWAYEFHFMRGAGSHAGGTAPSVYQEHQHLAFGDMLFCLLLKKRLQADGLYKMSEDDQVRLERIQGFLVHDPFAFDFMNEKDEEHPWTELHFECKLRRIGRALYPHMAP